MISQDYVRHAGLARCVNPRGMMVNKPSMLWRRVLAAAGRWKSKRHPTTHWKTIGGRFLRAKQAIGATRSATLSVALRLMYHCVDYFAFVRVE